MSEPMKSSMFTSSNLLFKFVAAAVVVSGAVAYYVLIGDGNISSIGNRKLRFHPCSHKVFIYSIYVHKAELVG